MTQTLCGPDDLFGRLPDPGLAGSDDAAGHHHDLGTIFQRLNRRFFRGKCDARLRWARRTRTGRRGRRSIDLGTYSFTDNTIRLHPALDQAFVPSYVVEAILYHEMLHWYIPPKVAEGRSYAHNRLFKLAERRHPRVNDAEKWKNENLDRLLRF